MNIQYEVIYMKGVNTENEDAFVTSEKTGIFTVIDGATGLGSLSGKIAAEILKETFEQASPNSLLLNIIHEGNIKIGKRVIEILGADDIHFIPKENRSTCGIASIKLKNNHFDYVHGGDCMIFIQYKNKEIRQVTYDHLAKLDEVSIELFKKAADLILKERGIPSTWKENEISNFLKETRQVILPKIIENRRRLNTPGGYGVIDGSPEATDYLDYGRINLHDAEKILLLSDGLQLPLKKANGQDAWIKTANYAFQNGLQALQNEVLNLENSDPACIVYPRLKQADDKTGILIDIK